MTNNGDRSPMEQPEQPDHIELDAFPASQDALASFLNEGALALATLEQQATAMHVWRNLNELEEPELRQFLLAAIYRLKAQATTGQEMADWLFDTAGARW